MGRNRAGGKKPVTPYEQWYEAVLRKAPPGKTLLLPQPGYQYKYLDSPADIVIGGGAAGAGKTFGLLIEAARHRYNPEFSAVIFRRLMPEIKNAGGLWDEAQSLYADSTGGRPQQQPLTWYFPTNKPRARHGARVMFSHLQYENDKYSHHGGQYPLICFDELTTFTEGQFWYLLSRNRTTVGMRPYVRCTTNPETQGWVKRLVSWWLYPDDHPDPAKAGFPIPERDGVLRYFARDKGLIFWGSHPRDVIAQVPHLLAVDDGIPLRHKIKSLTFIGGSVYGNKALLSKDPGYVGNLLAQEDEERNRLLYGCWKYSAGMDDLFDYAALLDLFTNDFVPAGNGSAQQRYITADIALEGSDKFVVMVWDGWRIIACREYQKSPGPAIVNTIREIASTYQVPTRNIAFDADGVGGFLRGFLRSAYGFHNGGKALAGMGEKEKRNYENLKTQCAYMARDMAHDAALYIEPGAMNDTQRQHLVEEARAHRKRDFDKLGPLKMSRKDEVKARIGRSPDYFDAFIMRQVFRLHQRGTSSTA